MNAIVTNIQGFSLHDGPGIRTVVFLKGCSLRCRWCANPEGLEAAPQIGFLRRLCSRCGACLSACPRGALQPPEVEPRIDHRRCTACGDCVEVCLYDALIRYGREQSVEEVFAAVGKDRMFYTGGGGVTVSGGEPLLYPAFVAALFSLCRADGISTCIETAGNVPRSSVEQVLPLTDLFLYDLKQPDPALHRRWTGSDNRQILQNARYLAEQGAQILFRQPLIPGVNDDEASIRQTAALLRSLPGGFALQLMPFHKLGQSKYQALGLVCPSYEQPAITAEQILSAQRAYEALGVSCSVSK